MPTAPADLLLYTNILKTLYPQDSVPENQYPESPLYGLLPKDEGWEGEEYAISNRYSASAGFSHTFDNANTNKSTPAWARFRVTDTQDYATFSVPGRVLRATKSDKGALVRALKAGGDAAFYKIKRRISSELYGDGSAVKGQITAGGIVGGVLTLVDPNDVKNFEVGDIVVSSAASNGTGLSVNASEIATINRALGTMTATTAGIPGWHADFSANDFLYIEGDGALGIAGLAGWIPAVAPIAGDNWFGFDRSVDTERQAGVRHTSTATVMSEALIDFGVQCMRAGCYPTHLFVGPDVWGETVRELQTQATYEKLMAVGPKGEMATVGFKALQFMTAAGMWNILPDIDCPPATGFALKLDTWTFASRGALPGWLEHDGNKMLRDHDSDSITGRIGYYGNMCCEAPGQNARANFTTAI
jgi:hypothetical protein